MAPPLESFFSPDGPLARSTQAFSATTSRRTSQSPSGWEVRHEQRDMALAIQEALQKQKHLIVEAGTGVGKSFAYLLPCALWAVEHKKKIVIATYTKALQEQLIRKDLPIVKEALGHVGLEFNYMHGKFGGTQTGSIGRFFTLPSGYTDSVTYQGTASISITDMGTIRARAGYAWGCFLPYAFAGIALGQADIIRTARIFGTQVNPAAAPGFQNVPFDLSATDAQNAHLIYGYSFGLGVDMQLVSNLFLRAEWEYVRFTTSIDTSINTGRIGLGYKF